jgi:ubiquinone/menaquinone biosynthesis C-methylase UbiE
LSVPPFNLQAVDEATDIALAAGHRILQTHRFDPDDDVHVDFLYLMMAPPVGAHILDAGCGLGEVSRLMAESDRSLTFEMLNISEKQLAYCPVGDRFNATHGNCHNMPYPDSSFDVVMFHSALCQMDEKLALAEAARVLRPDGILFINDMVARNVVPEIERLLAARIGMPEALVDAIKQAGFITTTLVMPGGDASHFHQMLSDEGHAGLIDGVAPVLVRAIKHTLES